LAIKYCLNNSSSLTNLHNYLPNSMITSFKTKNSNHLFFLKKTFAVTALLFCFMVSKAIIANAEAVIYKVTNVDSVAESKTQSIDNSLEKYSPSNFYYGYKLSSSGFFLAPELIKQASNSAISSNAISGISKGTSGGSLSTIENANSYNIKTNIGFDFNKRLSAFISYDLANISMSGDRTVSSQFNARNFDMNNISIGSQVNFNNNFGLKLSCSNQQISGMQLSNQSQHIGCNNLKIGTTYGF
jgi:hypothetical protein